MAQKSGAVGMVLFGTVFLSVGAGAGFFSIRSLVRAEAMLSWREVPANVVTCDLNVSRGSKGGSSYCVSARYQYEVDGKSHTGDRVSLHSGSDNIGQFHQRLYADLRRCADRKEPTTCWVNPLNPADAILIRKPRPELLIFMQLFALAFGGAGLGVVLAGLAGLAGLFQPAANDAQSGGQGQIRMRGASAHQVAGALALALNGYVGFVLWKASAVIGFASMPWYLWLLAAAGVIPAAVAAYLIRRIQKFGVSVFEMSPLPGVLGGPVNGTVRIPSHVETEDGFDVVLQCVHQYTTGSGKQRSTHRDVLWEDSRHIDGGHSYGDETLLPVRFSVPYERPATTVAGNGNGYYWRLNVTAAAPGIDYKAVFDVPVRHTPQSSPDFVPQRAPDPAAGLEPVEQVVERERLRLIPDRDGGFELVFPAARGGMSFAPLAVFLLVWSAACYVLWAVAKAPVLMAVIFTLIDALAAMLLLNAFLVSSGLVIDRTLREFRVWRRAAFLPKRVWRLPFDKVTDIRSERAMQAGNTIFYRVVLTVDEGRPVTAGAGLKMWNDAEDIAKLLRAAREPGFVLTGFRV